jgi:hypothetical protein
MKTLLTYAAIIAAILYIEPLLSMAAIEAAPDKAALIEATVGHLGWLIAWVVAWVALFMNIYYALWG